METFYIPLLSATSTPNPDIERFDAVVKHFGETMLTGFMYLFFFAMILYSILMMFNIVKYYVLIFQQKNMDKDEYLEVRFRCYNSTMFFFLLCAYLTIRYILLDGEELDLAPTIFGVVYLALGGFILTWITFTIKKLRKYNWISFPLMVIFACSINIILGVTSTNIIGYIIAVCAGLTILVALAIPFILRTPKALQ